MKNVLGHEETISTRCTPSWWCRIVQKLLEEQKVVVRALGFGHLLALNCGRLWLKICRWLVENFDTTSCSLHIHGRSHGNQEPSTGNDAHINGINDVLQLVKDIQASLKNELHDIITKVNLLYAKFNSSEDNNLNNDLPNTNIYQNSKSQESPNRYPPSLPLPSSRHVFIPAQQNPTVKSLDVVPVDDMAIAFPKSFLFITFSISYAKAPIQPNGFDCGLFLCMFVDDNCPTLVQMKSFQSDWQRLLLARFLALFPCNTNLSALKTKSEEHYNNLLSKNEVVPTVKMQRPSIQKLKGKATTLLD
ncbi:hypothetical protein Ddye_025892 [Dipteronia dyeriana]|uniref:Ubiquitin-like protease family profile domain-containing protein n=1 Tax=Dipteronia dyeriana TaxID=168575 RepID=A0AAD9TLP0_9ROSI|nr:hypothetical protein Ddye_025892 [Dipteronia dyeriana]